MKNSIFLFVVLLFAKAGITQNGTDHNKQAILILEELNKKEFAKIIPLFDSTLKSKLDTAQLRQVYSGLQMQIGAFVKSSPPANFKLGATEFVDQQCGFEKMPLVLRLGFDPKNKLCSFLFLPVKPKENYKDPAYVNKEKFEEKDIVVKTEGFEMPGTLTVPKDVKKFPIVILIHGSGPNGRDETIGSVKVFKDLANGLASNGVGVIRYDKRTLIYGKKSSDNIDSITVKEEVTGDVASAVKLARTIEGADTTKIFLIGHSLGAMLMPRMAAQIKGLAGVIMMAGNARPLEDVYLDQVIYLMNFKTDFNDADRNQLEQIKEQVLRVKKLGTIPNPPESELPLNLNAKYWNDLKNYHQVEVAHKLTLPIFIMQGERDYQVTMKDFTLWQQNLGYNKNVKFKSYPKLNHAFTEGEGKSKPDEYEKQANVPDYVINDILSFVKK